ncbi:FKBP-type peptidyl-prolyl cis-trans isomerase (trigger factor) [Agrobacterium larrymoorei]|uniref:FKBP-type peptidyl-prolyl cis-trans isomerase (Trigger factor) n=1 Tax=Agrobacterium larrymoorei TaxID=160699 RepID=A0AAJ2ERG0_9HYPH|nr:FKBP-type peptidyl-prolyl cis-trans isomerase (trigger factor) [Agrobacterium larrymoorei]
MQVIETLAEGLKREIKVVIPAADMKARLDERLAEAKDKVRINGFRPGKVPAAHLKKMYGKSIMADLVNELVREKPLRNHFQPWRKVCNPAFHLHDGR